MRALPNVLTAFRLVAAPFLAALLLWAERQSLSAGPAAASPWLWGAFLLFAVAAVTDALDGWLARRTNAVTKLGAALDHAADKTLVAAGLIAYAIAWAPIDLIAAAIVIVLRDLAVAGLREGVAQNGGAVPVGALGKAKTAAEMTGLGAALLLLPLQLAPRDTIAPTLGDLAARWIELVARAGLYAAAALAVVTLALYLRRATRAAAAAEQR